MTLTDARVEQQTDTADWQQRAETAERQLEAIYGFETITDWRTEGLSLPTARIDTQGLIVFEARVARVQISRGKDGAKLALGLVADLAGAPVKELAALTDDDLLEMRVAPVYAQPRLPISTESVRQWTDSERVAQDRAAALEVLEADDDETAYDASGSNGVVDELETAFPSPVRPTIPAVPKRRGRPPGSRNRFPSKARRVQPA